MVLTWWQPYKYHYDYYYYHSLSPVEYVVDLFADVRSKAEKLPVNPVQDGFEKVPFARVFAVEQLQQLCMTHKQEVYGSLWNYTHESDTISLSLSPLPQPSQVFSFTANQRVFHRTLQVSVRHILPDCNCVNDHSWRNCLQSILADLVSRETTMTATNHVAVMDFCWGHYHLWLSLLWPSWYRLSNTLFMKPSTNWWVLRRQRKVWVEEEWRMPDGSEFQYQWILNHCCPDNSPIASLLNSSHRSWSAGVRVKKLTARSASREDGVNWKPTDVSNYTSEPTLQPSVMLKLQIWSRWFFKSVCLTLEI